MAETTDTTVLPELAQQSEADLVLRARASEATVGTELARRYGAAIQGYAASQLGGDVEAAEDILVDTLADGIRNIRRFSPKRSSFRAWLYGIARRHIRTELRKRHRAKSVPAWAQVPISDEEQVPESGDMAVAVIDHLEARKAAARIAAALSGLEMEVLVLHCVDGFTAKEIGRILGRSGHAVESLLHRAKRRAREEVGST